MSALPVSILELAQKVNRINNDIQMTNCAGTNPDLRKPCFIPAYQAQAFRITRKYSKR